MDGHQSVGLVGFSAGGHLAGHAALTQSPDRADRVDFAILGYPIVSMQRNVYPTAGNTLLGPDASPALKKQTSLDKIVTAAAPPIFLWHTAEDAYVPVARHTGSPQHSPTPGFRIPPMCSHTDRTVWVSLLARKTPNSGPRSLSGGCTDWLINRRRRPQTDP